MKKSLLLWALLAALASAGMIGYWLYNVNETTKTKSYLRLAEGKSLDRGAQIKDEMIAKIDLPVSTPLDKIALEDTASNRDWLRGRTAAFDIEAGALVLVQQFYTDPAMGLAVRIGESKRAVSIPVSPQQSVAQLVEPGSIVDVIAVFDVPVRDSGTEARSNGNERESVARTILRAVKVLAVGTALQRSPYANLADRGYGTVTLELTIEDANRIALALAQTRSGIILALRNPVDVKPGDPPAEIRLETIAR